MRSLLLSLALLIPAAAAADTLTLRVSDAASSTFGTDGCGNIIRVNWTATLTYTPCTELKIWSTESGTCATGGPANNDKEIAAVSASTLVSTPSNSANVRVGDLPGQGGDGGFVCGSAVEKSWKICGAFGQQTLSGGFTPTCPGTPSYATSSVTVTYDGLPPTSPTLTGLEAQSQSLRAFVDVPDNATIIRMGVKLTGTADDFKFGSDVTANGDTATIDVSGLTNGLSYDVVAVSVDGAGNVSANSNTLAGTPTQTYGFWANYRNGGGAENGGCSVAPSVPGGGSAVPAGALILALGVGLIWGFRRMRS